MSGSWVTIDRPAYEMEIRACDACGAMIARKAYKSASGRLLCGAECEELEDRVKRLRSQYASGVDGFASLERSVSSSRD